MVPDHSATEAALEASGLAWTFLRNNLYAEYQVPGAAQAIATGQLVTNAAGGRTAYVSRDDCAAAAAAVLTSTGHENKSYDITGPQSVSAEELAALAGEIAGRSIEVVHVDDDAFVAGLTAPACRRWSLASSPASARRRAMGSSKACRARSRL